MTDAIESTPESEARWHVFLSHAHEDKEVVRALAHFIGKWRPPLRRLTVFVDETHLRAGPLKQEITQALARSQYLIVCCSRAAKSSEWVDLEIETFLEQGTDRAARVLACHVTSVEPAEASKTIPAALRRLEGDAELLRPDVSGLTGSSAEARVARNGANKLVATLHDFDSVARMSNRRWFIVAGSAAAVGVVAGTGSLLAPALEPIGLGAPPSLDDQLQDARDTWLKTDVGLAHATIEELLLAAKRDELELQWVLDGFEALGRLGYRDAIPPMSQLLTDPRRAALARAVGYASTRPPDCAAVDDEIAQVDDEVLQHWRVGGLLVARGCGPPLVERCRPADLVADVAHWAEDLARAGLAPPVDQLIETGQLPASEVFPIRAALARRTGQLRSLEDAHLAAWWNSLSDDGAALLDSTRDILRNLDHAGRQGVSSALRDPLKSFLLDVEVDQGYVRNTLFEIVAHLASVEPRWDLHELVERLDANPPRLGEEATSLAWRGLYHQRRGDADLAERAWTQVDPRLEAPVPGTRTWAELRDLVHAFALAGHWPKVFRYARRGTQAYVRTEHQVLALGLWAEHQVRA